MIPKWVVLYFESSMVEVEVRILSTDWFVIVGGNR